MDLGQLVIGDVYLYEGRRVAIVSVIYQRITVRWMGEVSEPFEVTADQLAPVGGWSEGEQVFMVARPTCVNPFDYPIGVVCLRAGSMFVLHEIRGSEIGARLGEYPTEKAARGSREVMFAGFTRPTELRSVGPCLVLREPGPGQVELASRLAQRLFGEAFTRTSGAVRVDEAGALLVFRQAWESLPEVQREALIRYVVGFGDGFGAGWGGGLSR